MPALRRWQGDLAHPPVLVGEDNPYGGRPANALLPYPAGSAGHRLCVKIFGMDPRQYMLAFLRYNLCTEKWWRDEALNRALALRELYPTNPFILLGSKVAQSFGLDYEPFYVRTRLLTAVHGKTLHKLLTVKTLILPHPSGRCREWNKPWAIERARDALEEVVRG